MTFPLVLNLNEFVHGDGNKQPKNTEPVDRFGFVLLIAVSLWVNHSEMYAVGWCDALYAPLRTIEQCDVYER